MSSKDNDELLNELNQLDTKFIELTTYLDQLDNDDGSNFMPVILSLSPSQLLDKLKAIETYANNLQIDEEKSMKKGRELNIFAHTLSSSQNN